MLGEGLRQVAPGETSRRRRPGWPFRPLGAIVTAFLLLAVASFVTWSTVPSGEQGVLRGFGPPPTGQELSAVDAVSPADVWAVGSRYGGGTNEARSLILHWDGTRWTRVPSPDAGPLTDVAAVSEEEAWAIGGGKILHWDGEAWEVVSYRRPPGAHFAAIDAFGLDDAWAVGVQYGAEWVDKYGEPNVGFDTLTMHWDGSTWSVVGSPNGAPRHNFLEGVLALSPTDVWAAGYAERRNHPRTLTLHWDGDAWKVVPSPDPGDDFNVLWATGTDRVGRVWAIGHYGDRRSPFMALYLRWTGEAWEVVPGPPGEALHQTPTAISGTSGSEVWAVGSGPTSSFLVAEWDGEVWSSVDAPLPGGETPFPPQLADVVALSPTDAWAVGRYQEAVNLEGGAEVLALIEHWDGTAWRVVEAPPPGRSFAR